MKLGTLPTLQEIRAEQARRSLYEFFLQAWEQIDPGTPLVLNWHIRVLCDEVQGLLEGRGDRRNLVINVPPGSLKSTIVSVCAPAWMWLRQPSRTSLHISGSDEVAFRDSMKCRNLIMSDWYQAFGPEWKMARDQDAKGWFRNTSGGERQATTILSKGTGKRVHDIYIDDPNDAKDVSEAKLQAVIAAYDLTFHNRLKDQTTGNTILIQQRTHSLDLTGHVLEVDGQSWRHVVIRQKFEEGDAQAHPGDPRTREGELFFPARDTPLVVAREERLLASVGFAGQHQQRPANKEGVIFKRGFIRFYDPTLPLPPFKRKVMSWDTAFKEKQQNDPSCGLVGVETDLGIYLIDHTLGRMSYPALKEKAKAWAGAHRPSALLIEDKASGQSLVQELQLESSFRVVPVQVDTDKVARAWAIVPTWEARLIYLPLGAEWVDAFLEELYAFPKAPHDDQVDAFTQLIRYLVMGGGATGLLDWMQQQAEGGAA